MKDYTLRDQLNAFKDDKDDPFLGDKSFFFYDWFCQDKSLKRKALALFPKVKKFVDLMGIDMDTHYVWFKNNCPLFGRLYDDFRIANIASASTIWTVSPSLGYDDTYGQAHVYGRENGFKEPIYQAKSWTELLKLLKEKKATP